MCFICLILFLLCIFPAHSEMCCKHCNERLCPHRELYRVFTLCPVYFPSVLRVPASGNSSLIHFWYHFSLRGPSPMSVFSQSHARFYAFAHSQLFCGLFLQSLAYLSLASNTKDATGRFPDLFISTSVSLSVKWALIPSSWTCLASSIELSVWHMK